MNKSLRLFRRFESHRLSRSLGFQSQTEARVRQLSLDIDVPKEKLRFIIRNGYEQFDYVIH